MFQRFKSQRGMCEPCAGSLKVSGILTVSFLWSGQGPASPGKAPRVGRGYNVSRACSVRGCTVPEAGASCRSRLHTYHGFFFLLSLLWSRHVKPSPAIGEKSEDSDSRKPKMYNLFLSGNSIKYKLRSTVQRGQINHEFRDVVTSYAKNLPRALRKLSSSRSAR